MDWLCWLAVMLAIGPMADAHKGTAKKPASTPEILWSNDPNICMEQMLNVSEDLRPIQGEWSRFWMIDQPSHLTPIRTHGGVGP